eukprot:CAMPEP_0202699246 /NCGR_PEP_ID=MMETSP1385-20130828/12468_1 /ASSEMBLY_ACC=CAM_ASM_000861 /TAXON_ID=933848 /ORGANISM="Elphidium margaritaceum" /LENGTH=278 /DNA_ID=CAMNT_0049356139 /DNA_START=32 /DNA_END=864 /DNA_ORIENTATION=-
MTDALGEGIQLLYGQFQLRLDEIDDLVTSDVRGQRVNELNNNSQKTIALINETFQAMLDSLHERKRVLIKEVNKIKAEKIAELDALKKKDADIQDKMRKIKTECRQIISDKSPSNVIAQKRKKLEAVLQNKYKANVRKSLNPALDDPTLALVSFRVEVSPIKQQIAVLGKIDNEEAKTVENLQHYFKLKDGKMKVTVECAQGLKAADANGYSDPYVVLHLNQDKKKQKTKVVKKSVNPRWDEQFELTVSDAVRDVLHLAVFDKDAIGKDEPLGEITIP